MMMSRGLGRRRRDLGTGPTHSKKQYQGQKGSYRCHSMDYFRQLVHFPACSGFAINGRQITGQLRGLICRPVGYRQTCSYIETLSGKIGCS